MSEETIETSTDKVFTFLASKLSMWNVGSVSEMSGEPVVYSRLPDVKITLAKGLRARRETGFLEPVVMIHEDGRLVGYVKLAFLKDMLKEFGE